jgi:2-polyprenyl-3-methyl-5-hydroxy-6-metoxy-1,4-benzoquinol methylase
MTGTSGGPIHRLARSVARHCHGRSAVLGRDVDALAAAVVGHGVELERHSRQFASRECFDTVLLADAVEHLSEDAAKQFLTSAWREVRVGGRLVVVAPNGASSPREGRPLDRRKLKRLLEPLGKPELVQDQPYRWVTMSVRKLEEGRKNGEHNQTLLDRFAATADLCRGRVVELGCGAGDLAHAIAERGSEVTGVDISSRKVQRARASFPELTFILADILTVDLPAEAYDTVVLAEVLEHVTDAPGQAILDKAWSLVASGGRLVVSVPNENCIPHPNHLRQFDEKRLRSLLAPLGSPVVVRDQPYKWLMMYVDRGT